MGFRDRSGIDLENELDPDLPRDDRLLRQALRARGNWSPPATTLNFSIGQGENTQTLINMIRFYEGLAGNGESPPPYIVRPATRSRESLGLTRPSS